MNVIYTVLLALPLGFFLSNRSTAILTYLLAGSYLFSFQSTGVILDWLGHNKPSAFGPFPDHFPAKADTSEYFGYGIVNLAITVGGIVLVLAGSWLRARREAKRAKRAVIAVG